MDRMVQWFALAGCLLGCRLSFAADAKPTLNLTVAAVQMRSSRDLSNNVAQIKAFIHESGAKGARFVVFPECALTGYFEDIVTSVTAAQLAEAEASVAAACVAARVYVV